MKSYQSVLTTVCISTLLYYACGPAGSGSAQNPVSGHDRTEVTTVPLYPIVFEGNRYVVKADFGLQQQVPLMVHGNASLYLMLTHRIAEQLNDGAPIQKLREYGYSEKGFGTIQLDSFRIGDRAFFNPEPTPVFDWPDNVGTSAQGMLGLEFLKRESCVIDFNADQLTIGSAVNGKPDSTLIDKGYFYSAFFIENGRAYMMVHFNALNTELPITVGTVADDYVLDAPVFKQTIRLEETDINERSPNSTTPRVFTNTTPITFRIAGQVFEVPSQSAELYSLAEYANIPQSELQSFGIFGRDWMKEHHAVIDYANQVLYFKDPL
jgi:hypothetical protein